MERTDLQSFYSGCSRGSCRVKAFLVCAALVVLAAPVASAGRPGKLPPGTLRGNEHLLDEYPTVALATYAERVAAVRLLAEIRTASRKWPNPEDGSRGRLRHPHRTPPSRGRG